MNNLIITILIILYGLPVFSNTEESDQKIIKANKFYEQTNYEEALELYKEIIAEGYTSAGLFFNTANTYYRLNNLGLSVYFYEKAKLSDPFNEDINYNLELALLRIKDNPAVIPEFAFVVFLTKIIMFKSGEFWGVLSLILFITFLTGLFYYLSAKSSRQKKIRFLISVFIFVFSLISFLFAQYQIERLYSDNIGIIISQEINAKSSPDENATDIFKIYEGYKVYIENKSNNWSEIKLTNGEKAWIKSENIKIL